MAQEEWRPVVGWETTHEVSNHGRVRRHINSPRKRGHYPGHIHRGRSDSAGYPHTDLTSGDRAVTVRIHRLVAEAWLPKPDGRLTVNHIDGDKTNNRVENLEWATLRENLQHAHRTGLVPYAVGSQAGNAKFDEETASAIISEPDSPGVVRRLARVHGVAPSTISRMRSGKQWAHLRT